MISQAVKLTIAVESEEESLTGETDESYAIDIYKSPGKKVKQISFFPRLSSFIID